MPLDAATTAIRAETRTLLRNGGVPSEPTNVRATWMPKPCGGDHLFVGWQQPREAGSVVKMWAVYWKEADQDDHWQGPHYTRTNSLEICCPFHEAREIDVCVCAIAPNGAQVSPVDATNAVLARPEPGLKLKPTPVTDLIGERTDDSIILRWTEADFGGRLFYEIRLGAQWETATVWGETERTEFELRQFPVPTTLKIFVAARAPGGIYGTPAILSFAATDSHPGGYDVKNSYVVTDFSVNGTRTNLDLDGSTLVMGSGQNYGYWISDTYDTTALGYKGQWTVGYMEAICRNRGLLWKNSFFKWSDGEGVRRTWEWGHNEPEWSYEQMNRRRPDRWSEATYQWNSTSGKSTTWGGHRWGGRKAIPDNMTWAEARFAWNSWRGKSSDWEGPNSSEGTRVLLEFAFSTDNTTWTAWVPAMRHQAMTRYFKMRVQIWQPQLALPVRVNSVAAYGIKSRYQFFTEEPAGSKNGINTIFTLAQRPDPNSSLQLYKNGILMIRTVDYDFTGLTITFVPAHIPDALDTLIAYGRY